MSRYDYERGRRDQRLSDATADIIAAILVLVIGTVLHFAGCLP